MRLNKDYIMYFHLWTWTLLTGIIPFSILIILNWKIYSARRRLQQSLTKKKCGTLKTALVKASLLGGSSPSKCQDLPKDDEKLRAKKRETRAKQQSKECNLAIILMCTVATFFFFHFPRLLTSVYEAATFHKQERCTEKNLDYLPLWFLYSIVAMNVMLVVNASSNFWIYLFAGKLFKQNLGKIIDCRPDNSNKKNTCDVMI